MKAWKKITARISAEKQLDSFLRTKNEYFEHLKEQEIIDGTREDNALHDDNIDYVLELAKKAKRRAETRLALLKVEQFLINKTQELCK